MVASIAVGRRFGPYEIRNVLGKGASATVYLGRRSDGEDVAVKVLSSLAMGNSDFRRAVPREFNALQKVDDRGVIRANKMGTIADVLFIELEWIDGPTLDQTFQPGKALGLRESVDLAIAMSRALQSCHDAGVVHRDVKPSNVLLRSPQEPVLFDFGLALDANEPDAEAGRLYATPMTASPEQISADGPVDGRADLYALGVTLYRMVTGKLPFYGERMELLRMHAEVDPEPAAEANQDVPAALSDLISQAMEKAPDDRFSTVAAFGEALGGLPSDLLVSRKRGFFRR